MPATLVGYSLCFPGYLSKKALTFRTVCHLFRDSLMNRAVYPLRSQLRRLSLLTLNPPVPCISVSITRFRDLLFAIEVISIVTRLITLQFQHGSSNGGSILVPHPSFSSQDYGKADTNIFFLWGRVRWGLALELEPDPVCTLWERFWFAQTIHLHMAKECSLSWLEISVGEKIERKLGRHLQISELDYSYNVEALFLCLVMMGWPIDDIKRLRKALLGFIFFLRFDALCRLNHFVVCPIQL